MRKILVGALIGFGLGMLLAFTTPATGVRHPTPPTNLGASNNYLWVHDSYVSGATAGIANMTPKSAACSQSQAIGMYDDGGTLSVNCMDLFSGTQTVVTTPPTAPSSDSQVTAFWFAIDAGWLGMPMGIDNLSGMAPMGMLGEFSQIGTLMNWDSACVWPATWASASLKTYRTSASQVNGTASGNAWSSASLLGRLKATTYFTASAANNIAEVKGPTGELQMWRGNATGAGGFIWWARMETKVTSSKNRLFAGLNTTTSTTGVTDPSTFTDVVGFACNAGDTTISVISNDNSGTATTASTLDGGFPCGTDTAFYDFWLYAPPNASVIRWYTSRLDEAHEATGEISTDLPRNTVQLAWHSILGTGDGGTSVTLGFLGSCYAAGF